MQGENARGDGQQRAGDERGRLERSGFLAGAAFPIRAQGTVRGLLGVYADRRDFFQDKEIALRQYAGILSPYARIARLCSQETDVHGLANWVIDQVVKPETGETIAAE